MAVVGATETDGKLGKLVLENLRRSFAGRIHPINPKRDRVMGLDAHPTIRSIDDQVDLAVVTTPAESIFSVVEDCVTANVKFAVLMAGGFSETGRAGASMEASISACAREGGVRLVGPNCFGVVDTRSGLNASLAMGLPAAGGVSLFTQSGAYGMAAFSLSSEGRIGFRRILAPGNKVDVDEIDAISWLSADPGTRVIALVLESIADGAALFESIRKTEKPVVVLKTGRGRAAKRAAASHTGALASDARIAAAVVSQAGGHWVTDGRALFDTAAALDLQPPLLGSRIGVITNSGGTGVELVDLLEAEGLDIPRLSEPLELAIRPSIPQAGSAGNPIDVTTDWSRFPSAFGNSLRVLLASSEVDGVILILLQRAALDRSVAERVVREVDQARAAGNDMPVHVCWVAPSEGEPVRRFLTSRCIPCHPWPLRTARAVAATRQLAIDFDDGTTAAEPVPAPDRYEDEWMPMPALFEALARGEFPVAKFGSAETAEDAIVVANGMEYPVVLKAMRAGLVHRTRRGALRLNIEDEAGVRNAFEDLEAELGPGPVFVQSQKEPGVEILLGVRQDPSFGMVIVAGLGGIWVEVLDDVAIRRLPVSEAEALSMLSELRGQSMLDGFGSMPKVDRCALARLIARVSQWAAARPWISELDLNPVIARGASLSIVDARLRSETGMLT